MDHPHLPYWLAALHMPNIGPRKLMRWLESFAHIKALFHAASDQWRSAGISADDIQILQHPHWRLVEHDLSWANTPLHHLICFDDEDYPALLKEIAAPPLVLYVRGNKNAMAA